MSAATGARVRRLRGAIGALLDATLDVVLPSVCPACSVAAGPALCPACLTRIERLTHPCRWCATPAREPQRRCPACDNRGLPHLARVSVGCVYRGVVENLVGDAKAGARPAAGRALAGLMPAPPEPGALAVVPIPAARGRRPGPHLATALARALARRIGVPCRRLLRTTRLAAEQHRLAKADRRRNVAGLFIAASAPAHVVLVDDLLTSGATASAAAGALRAAGAKRVDLVCLARTPKRGE